MVLKETQDNVGKQTFDKLYAYSQSLNKDFVSNLHIEFNDTPKQDFINILYCYLPRDSYNLDDYDFVIFDNADEPMGMVCTDIMQEHINSKNVYMQVNSVFHESKDIDDSRIIRLHGDVELFKDFVNRPFYPQYYQPVTTKKDLCMCYINGQNRAHRNHFLTLMQQHNLDIPMINNYSDTVHETKDSALESTADSVFRDFVNEEYQNRITRNRQTSYYDDSIGCGIDEKMGRIPPGYFSMPEYTQYKVIVFPETSWINDELSVTEKALKCFYNRCLPFPVAGRHVNELYNRLGFYTAWNLLPEDLQKFDQEEDHQVRYVNMLDALSWIQDNIDNCNEFDNYVNHNYNTYLGNKFSKFGVEKLFEIISKI